MDTEKQIGKERRKKCRGIIKNISRPCVFICGEYEYEYHEPVGKYAFG